MIEITLKNYLQEKLKMPVYLENPEDAYDQYIKIEKTNGYIENYLCYVTFAIQSYAPSMYEASLLNERVKEKMINIIELDDVSKVKLTRDYNFTDTTKKLYRYQAIFEMVVYE